MSARTTSRWWGLVWVLFLVPAAGAQEQGTADGGVAPAPGSATSPPQPVIDTGSGEEAAAAAQALNRAELEEPLRPRYIVETIEVRGNSKTRGDLIISTLLCKPGESLDEEKVDLSRIRLLALGYFKDVRMHLEKGSSRGRVKLVVEVDERNTIIVDDLFMGFSSTNPFWGGLGISDINFLGRGMVVSLSGVASKYQWALRPSLFWPSVANTNLQLGVAGLFLQGQERALQDRMGTNNDQSGCGEFLNRDMTLDYKRFGGMFTAGLRVDRVHRLAVDLRVEYVHAARNTETGLEPTDGDGEKCSNYPFLGYIKDADSLLSSLTFRFERDTRDNFFLPTQGMLLQVSVELASQVLGSNYEYSWRWRA